MSERIRERMSVKVTAGLLGGVLLTGCGAGSQEVAPPPTTHALPNTSVQEIPPAKWTCTPIPNTAHQVPEEYVAVTAQKLGHSITEEQVRDGGMGLVHCNDHALTKEDVGRLDDSDKIAVAGVAPLCFVVGLESLDGDPQDGIRYKDLAAVCPAMMK